MNETQSASPGFVAFLSVRASKPASVASAASAVGSSSRAKDTARQRSLGQAMATLANCSALRSSPSKLSSSRRCQRPGGSARSRPTSRRKHPSNCSDVQVPGLRSSTETSVSHSQKRTSKRAKRGHSAQRASMCRSSRPPTHSTPSSSSAGTSRSASNAAPEMPGQPPRSKDRRGPPANSAASDATATSLSSERPRKLSLSSVCRLQRRMRLTMSPEVRLSTAFSPRSMSRQREGCRAADWQARHSEQYGQRYPWTCRGPPNCLSRSRCRASGHACSEAAAGAPAGVSMGRGAGWAD
mmetsp:Transcript_9016/g.27410  ORF Transcript_9016/g.27410 Transcript_9016/m.27410 type:complete len:297 (-) Transcript_9016:29-919(-)